MKLQPLLLLLALPLLLTGCDENDAASIKLRLKDDGAGTLTVSNMSVPGEPTRAEMATTGVAYDKRVELAAATGRFGALSGITVSDITFSAGEGEGGFRFVKITLPQGPNAQWPNTFIPFDERTRIDAAGALDPSGKAKDVGANLKIELELPAPAIGNGLTGKVRGTKASNEGSTATLVVPIQASRAGGEPLVWHLTWQR